MIARYLRDGRIPRAVGLVLVFVGYFVDWAYSEARK